MLDCFNGSGSTMIACQNTGRSFKGCEFDEEYYNKSLERMKTRTLLVKEIVMTNNDVLNKWAELRNLVESLSEDVRTRMLVVTRLLELVLAKVCEL